MKKYIAVALLFLLGNEIASLLAVCIIAVMGLFDFAAAALKETEGNRAE